jgi:hypothetical protein
MEFFAALSDILLQTVQNKGTVYLTATRWYGDPMNTTTLVPAIYWAFIRVGRDDLCNVTLTAAGVVTSEQQPVVSEDSTFQQDTLAFAYPTIAATAGGGARLVYAFSGAGSLPGSLGSAYAGNGGDELQVDVSATTTVALRTKGEHAKQQNDSHVLPLQWGPTARSYNPLQALMQSHGPAP